MANLITIARLVALYIVIYLMYVGGPRTITFCIFALLIIFASDGLDGWVARRRKSTSDFGAMFDIASDRIVENSLWVVFAHQGLIPVWIPLLVLGRGFIVDGLRSLSFAEGMTAFGENNLMRSSLTRWLTAGRFMRALYGYAKAAAFAFLAGLMAWEHADIEASDSILAAIYQVDAFRLLGWVLVYGSVVLTVVRGVPVVVDALAVYGPNAQRPEPATAKDESR
jgi:CDP-diacylglycerol---glycerol-3-phosphate 3-phosphatidyltransferase